jgi:long-subunit fatty acid transport protein
MYELGIAYRLNEKLDLGLSYNNRRGPVVDLSFKF